MKDSPLPLEFAELSGKVFYVRERIRGREWSSSCPKCGGIPHQNGQFPDRFRMWTKSKIGKPFGWCRACNYKWTSERDYKPDPARIEAWRQERLEYERQRKAEAEMLARRQAAWELRNAERLARGEEPLPKRSARNVRLQASTLLAVAAMSLAYR
mgnify:CR=1 FL=1